MTVQRQVRIPTAVDGGAQLLVFLHLTMHEKRRETGRFLYCADQPHVQPHVCVDLLRHVQCHHRADCSNHSNRYTPSHRQTVLHQNPPR